MSTYEKREPMFGDYVVTATIDATDDRRRMQVKEYVAPEVYETAAFHALLDVASAAGNVMVRRIN